jgi:hypothetical protein
VTVEPKDTFLKVAIQVSRTLAAAAMNSDAAVPSAEFRGNALDDGNDEPAESFSM